MDVRAPSKAVLEAAWDDDRGQGESAGSAENGWPASATEAAQPECAAFAAAMRELARQFQFEAIARELARAAPVTVGDPK